jgi:hypothetical protein
MPAELVFSALPRRDAPDVEVQHYLMLMCHTAGKRVKFPTTPQVSHQ